MLIYSSFVPCSTAIFIRQANERQDLSEHFLEHIQPSSGTNVYQNSLFIKRLYLCYLFFFDLFRFKRSNVPHLFYSGASRNKHSIDIKNQHLNCFYIFFLKPCD